MFHNNGFFLRVAYNVLLDGGVINGRFVYYSKMKGGAYTANHSILKINKKALKLMLSRLCAHERNRTFTSLRMADFESAASTNSATWAFIITTSETLFLCRFSNTFLFVLLKFVLKIFLLRLTQKADKA